MISTETTINFIVGAKELVIGIAVFFLALLAVVWKGKKEIHDAIGEDIDPIKKSTASITSAIVEIQTILKEKFRGLVIDHALVEKGSSPLQPTEFGASLIKDSGLEKILNDNKEDLCVKLKASLPTNHTEYDVQEKARALLVSLKNYEMMNPVKDWVYTHPMEIEIILNAGGLWLRDDFLKKPRGINKTP
jgi:hypothetical protein